MALADWRAIYFGAPSRSTRAAAPRSRPGRRRSTRSSREHEPVYGINTGFGKLASVRIPDGDLAQLQRNLVLSHAAGVGEPLPAPVVRLMMALKVASLGAGRLRRALGDARRICSHCLKRGLVPVVPAQGSVGASGDLAPLAHLAAALIGEGEFVRRRRAAAGAPRRSPAPASRRSSSRPKEGLALLNGTQVSTALALAGLFEAERVFQARARRRRAVDRRGARLATGRSTPASRRCAATAARSRSRRRFASCSRQRHPRLASDRRRPRAGPLLPALPAAGDGRLPRPPAPGRATLETRGERRLRQPAGLRRRRRGDLGRQFPRRAGRLRGRHDRARAVPRSAPSPSAASPC